MLSPEDQEGNIEYKRYLINIDSERFEQLSTQMKWRLAEGDNEAIYYLGVNDNGSLYNMTENEIKETLFNFTKLVKNNHAEIINFYKIVYNDIIYFKIIIRKKYKIYPEIRVVLLGGYSDEYNLNNQQPTQLEQTGKTTFLSNIILNKTDANNDARIYLMNHKHELITKKTSSFNCHYYNYSNYKFSFMETPGFKEYQKTKYKILLGSNPNVCVLFTNKYNEINPFDLFIVENLKIPHLILNIYDPASIYNCKKLIDKKLFFDQLIKIQKPTVWEQKPTKFNILNIYPHTDLGIIMSGFLVSGCLEINKPIYWITKDHTVDCKIKSIHINCEPVNKCASSHMLTICIKPNQTINSTLNKKYKNGILSNKQSNNKSKITFEYNNFSETKLLNNLTGYLANRSVLLNNITEIKTDLYTCLIDNYYNEPVIIIDTDNIKGIGIIKHWEYL